MAYSNRRMTVPPHVAALERVAFARYREVERKVLPLEQASSAGVGQETLALVLFVLSENTPLSEGVRAYLYVQRGILVSREPVDPAGEVRYAYAV